IEFCAGSSGPTPTFDRLINRHRAVNGEASITFILTDKYPNIKAWNRLRRSHASPLLELLPMPIDATDPPLVQKAGQRVFRLFNCSFHHFNDAIATQILKSTLETSDGFAIIELQDRRLGMLIMMLSNWIFVCRLIPPPSEFRDFVSPENDYNRYSPLKRAFFRLPIIRVLLGYLIWFVILIVLQFDGFVSCLRTREFDEFVQLAQQAAGEKGTITIRKDGEDQVYDLPYWEIRAHKPILHTLPFGYLRVISGVRKVPN
ncbi:hypothetical protein BU23DRAFT_450470, partial [Bimuria novae-zelandiae CBS 107.79]